MDPRKMVGGLLVLSSAIPCAEAVTPLYDPKLCYILDGFLLLYGLVITGLLLKEKYFTTKVPDKVSEGNDGLYSDLNHANRDLGGYGEIKRLDPERGERKNRRNTEETYTPLQRATDDTYKEITVTEQKRRRNKNDQVYQGLSSATKDTYDSLQMQPLPPPPPR